MQDALDDLERVVAPLEADQELSRRPERVDRVVHRLDAATGFREAQVRQRIGLVESDHAPEYVDGVAIPPRALQSYRGLVVRRERVAGEPELRVDGRELRDDVPVAILELRDVLLDELADLLVNRDGFQRETQIGRASCR